MGGLGAAGMQGERDRSRTGLSGQLAQRFPEGLSGQHTVPVIGCIDDQEPPDEGSGNSGQHSTLGDRAPPTGGDPRIWAIAGQ